MQNYEEGVVRGIYAGAPVRPPMTDLTVANLIGYDAPPSTLPEFGAFLFTVIPKGGAR